MKSFCRYFLSLVLAFVSALSLWGQVYNAGNFVVRPNENVYVQGGFTNKSGGTLTLQGTIHLKGDWANNDASASIITNSSGGLVRFIGAGPSAQNIGGSKQTNFHNIEVSNSFNLNLNQNAQVDEVLTLTDGKIITNSNSVIVTSTSTSAIANYNTSRYIVGNLRRYFTGTTNSYDIPIGTIDNYELANVKFNSYTGITYLDTRFDVSAESTPPAYPSASGIYVYPDIMNPISSPLNNPMSRYSYIAEFLNYGYWTIAPNAGSSSNFKFTLTSRGHSNGGVIPGQHAILRRSNSSDSWKVQGYFVGNSQSGSGASNPITVNMDQMSTSSISMNHFIIGKSTDYWGPLSIVLVKFDAVCDVNRVHINWTTSNEDQNDYFTIEKSKNLYFWEEVTRVKGSSVSQGNIDYQAFDNHPYPGVSYYRLKQTDLNGTSVVFEDQWIQYVSCSSMDNNEVLIYPDSKHRVNVVYSGTEGDSYNIRIHDLMGRLIAEKEGVSSSGINTISVNTASAYGIYLVSLRTSSSFIVKKLIMPE